MPGSLARYRLAALLLALGACSLALQPGCDGGGGDSGGKPAKTMPVGMQDSGLDRPWANAGSAQDREVRPPPAFRFEDASALSGLTATNHSGRAGVKEYLLEAVGVGPACLDFDNDGLMDFYVPDGDEFDHYDFLKEPDPRSPGKLRPVVRRQANVAEPFLAHLYHNLGDGRFEDVAVRAGVTNERWGFGALAWDYDADGFTDLLVCNFGKNRLYRNNGNGTFTDVAEAVGLAGDDTSWNTCATCGDYDGDGRLDLYVARYADPAVEVARQVTARNLPEGTPLTGIPGRLCKWRGVDAYCGPVGLEAQHDSLYHQESDGTFRDVSVEAGVRPKAAKYGFTSYFFDYDQDGLPDIYVANDSEENFLWHQERKDGKPWFRDVAEPLGVKFGQQQNPQASMGCATADINQDGLLDIFVTNFSHDYNNIFIGARYPGGVAFKDRGLQVMGQAVFYDLAWGCGWYDFDLDADLDLLVANGHVYKEVDLFDRTGTSYEQYPAVFECLEAKKLRYREVGPKPFKGPNAKPPAGLKEADLFAGQGLEVAKKCNRGACFNDADNDGDVDVVLFSMNAEPTYLRNELERGPTRHWLKLVVKQPGTKNVDAIGAVVRVRTPDGTVQTFPVYRCQSFLGTDDPRIPVGLGGATRAEVTVTWPGAEKVSTVHADLAADAAYVLTPDGKSAQQALKPVLVPGR